MLDGLFKRVFRKFDEVITRHDRMETRQDRMELNEKLNWQEQQQFNKEIGSKVDMLTESVQALDKRVRNQDDMPERLKHVEDQQHSLARRVFALEQKR